jgi:RNA polymerase sigma-70 factor (ECF subfamily)
LKKRRQFLTRIGLRSADSEEDHQRVTTDKVQLNAEEEMIENEIKAILHLAIDRLPVNQRIAFTMNKYEKLSYQEIAEVMNVSRTSVESLIHRAKLNLQKRLVYFYRDNI